VATNDTSEARAKNRRVEIRALINKGISSQADSQQTASEDEISSQP